MQPDVSLGVVKKFADLKGSTVVMNWRYEFMINWKK